MQKRDPQGRWSIIAADGAGPGQVIEPEGLATDGVGNLYVADYGNSRVQKYTVETPVGQGDLNADGRVTLGDVTLALQIAVGAAPATGYGLQRADVVPKKADGTVGDGVVNLLDVTRLLRRAVGLEPDPWP